MKSEKAKQYLKNNREEVEINWETGETAWMIWPEDARKAVEIAEQEAEERVYEKLTRWNDPKNRPPYGVSVLIKVFCVGGEKIYLGNIEIDNVWVTDGGLIFTDDAKNDDEYVVGWREIL